MRRLSSLWLIIVLCSATAAVAERFDSKAAEKEFTDALRLAPVAIRGERIFATCSACHGVDGSGLPDGSTPAIAGQHYPVLLRQLIDYRHAARWDMRMEHVARLQLLANLQDLADVAAFVADREPGRQPAFGDGEHLDRGVRSYFDRCQLCHGATGQGDAAQRIARLAGQHPDYLQRQFADVLEGRRPRLTESHTPMMQGLELADIQGIADYLSRTQRKRSNAP